MCILIYLFPLEDISQVLQAQALQELADVHVQDGWRFKQDKQTFRS